MIWVFGKNLKTDYIKIGNLEDTIRTEGVFVRDEKLLNSPIDGKCLTEVSMGEKIGVNQSIGKIVNDLSEDTVNELKYVDKRILDLISKEFENTEGYSEDILHIDDEISDKLKDISYLTMCNNISGSEKLTSDIDRLMKRKVDVITNTNIIEGSQIELLKQKRDRLLKKTDKSTIELKSDTSGIIAFFVDGYENILTPKKIEKLKLYKLKDINNISNEKEDFRNFEVKKNKPYGKVITDYNTKVIFGIKKKYAGFIKKNEKIRIEIRNIDKIVEGRVLSKTKDGRNYIVIANFSTGLSDTCTLRKADLEILLKPYSGYKVPLKSLLSFDKQKMTAKLMLVKSNFTIVKNVSVVVFDDDFAIVNNLDKNYNNGVNLYDEYVIEPYNVREGQMVMDEY